MPYDTLFPSFPDDAACWIYAADRPLTDAEARRLEAILDDFFAGWTSHGRSVRAAASVQDRRFLLIAATLEEGDISGCGIDASTHVLEDAAQQLGVRWLPALTVFYRDGEGAVRSLSRSAFRRRVAEGEITAHTPVFDVSLRTVGALRSGRFERAAGASWHARVFRIPEPAS